MAYYNVCPHCGCNLDPGEKCDCESIKAREQETSRGKMLLESKEEMKKRGIDSPDRADAVALSCYQKKTFNIGSLVD